jgi:CRISPR system Cascade subunit CasE
VSKWFVGDGDGRGVALQHGFRAEAKRLRVDAYRQHRFHRRDAKPIRISTVDLTGVLEVTEAERVRRALLYGLGHAKAFGCGLLRVRRIG